MASTNDANNYIVLNLESLRQKSTSAMDHGGETLYSFQKAYFALVRAFFTDDQWMREFTSGQVLTIENHMEWIELSWETWRDQAQVKSDHTTHYIMCGIDAVRYKAFRRQIPPEHAQFQNCITAIQVLSGKGQWPLFNGCQVLREAHTALGPIVELAELYKAILWISREAVLREYTTDRCKFNTLHRLIYQERKYTSESANSLGTAAAVEAVNIHLRSDAADRSRNRLLSCALVEAARLFEVVRVARLLDAPLDRKHRYMALNSAALGVKRLIAMDEKLVSRCGAKRDLLEKVRMCDVTDATHHA